MVECHIFLVLQNRLQSRHLRVRFRPIPCRTAYHLERLCLEDGSVEVRDGAHWLVLNACAWRAEEGAGQALLSEYVHTSEAPDDGLVHRIQDAIHHANADVGWRENAVGFMTVEHDHRAQLHGARRVGMQFGRQEEAERLEVLINALLDTGCQEDLKRAANDAAYREHLFEELGI